MIHVEYNTCTRISWFYTLDSPGSEFVFYKVTRPMNCNKQTPRPLASKSSRRVKLCKVWCVCVMCKIRVESLKGEGILPSPRLTFLVDQFDRTPDLHDTTMLHVEKFKFRLKESPQMSQKVWPIVLDTHSFKLHTINNEILPILPESISYNFT